MEDFVIVLDWLGVVIGTTFQWFNSGLFRKYIKNVNIKLSVHDFTLLHAEMSKFNHSECNKVKTYLRRLFIFRKNRSPVIK